METLKNFLVGLLVVILSVVILGLIMITWPFLIGISSVVLAVIAAVLFIVLVFYIIVLLGHLVRMLLKKEH